MAKDLEQSRAAAHRFVTSSSVGNMCCAIKGCTLD